MTFETGDYVEYTGDFNPKLFGYKGVVIAGPTEKKPDNVDVKFDDGVTRGVMPKSLTAIVKTTGILGTQVGGSHYTDCAIQPIEYIWANKLGFSEGNIIKYVTRYPNKGGIKDLEKARHHISLLIERLQKEQA